MKRFSSSGADRNRWSEVAATRLPIETVAAGGGSVLHCQDDRLLVGPARQGPSWSGLLPRWRTAHDHRCQPVAGSAASGSFPRGLWSPGNQPPDLDVVRDRFQLANQLQRKAEQLAEAALQLAIERMADAIRRLLHRGQDVRGGAVAYGGRRSTRPQAR